MGKIKTRETVKNIKTIDKAAIAGERMKNAFIRSKNSAENLMDDRQIATSEYAEDKVMYAAEDISRDAAHLAGSGIKSAANKDKEVFQRRRAQKAAERQQERDLTSNQPTSEQSPMAEAKKEPPTGQSPSLENQIDGAAEQPNATGTEWTLSPQTRPARQGDQPVSGGSSDTPLYSDTDRMVEQGQELTKKKTRQKAEVGKQIKQQTDKIAHQPVQTAKPTDASSGLRHTDKTIQAAERPAQFIGKSVHGAKAPVRSMEQTAKSTGKATAKTTKGTIKTSQRAVKTAQQTSKAAIKTTQATAKAAQKTAQATAKAARAASAAAKAAAVAAKTVAKAVAAAGKAIIAGSKMLIAAIAAGGWVAVIVIVVICMVGLIAGSCYGIFFVDEDTDSELTLQSVIQEIDAEYQSRIDEIIATVPHNTVEISGKPAPWNEVLTVYAVKTTTAPDNAQEVASMDAGKKILLKEIFWAMNVISARTETFPDIVDENGNIVQEQTTVAKTVLYITVSHKTAEEMTVEYGFTEDQQEQLAALLAEENNSLWSGVLII